MIGVEILYVTYIVSWDRQTNTHEIYEIWEKLPQFSRLYQRNLFDFPLRIPL